MPKSQYQIPPGDLNLRDRLGDTTMMGSAGVIQLESEAEKINKTPVILYHRLTARSGYNGPLVFYIDFPKFLPRLNGFSIDEERSFDIVTWC